MTAVIHPKQEKPLSPRQKEVLDFIQAFIEEKKVSPSYREIMSQFDFSSTASVAKHVRTLERKGYLSFEKRSARSIQIMDSPSSSPAEISLPFAGSISEKKAICTPALPSKIPVARSFINKIEDSYVLKVEGDAFAEEHMIDGDYLIVEARSYAEEGEMVIALIHGLEVVIKYYSEEEDYLQLKSAHPGIKPMIFRKDAVEIQGIVSNLFRKFKRK